MEHKRVLILGSDGMAGHLIIDYLSGKDSYKLFGISEEYFLTQKCDYLNKILNYNPDIIINTLRITGQDCDKDPQKAVFINSLLPIQLKNYLSRTIVRIIHLSTDCVFLGNRGNYNENDLPDGISMYSMTKACGEIINNKDLTIRTSYIGPNIIDKDEELFDWFLKQSGEIHGYKNAYWNGITTLELAKKIDLAIKNNIHGLYHLGSTNNISKFDLLSAIKKRWDKKDIIINEDSIFKLNRSLIDTRKELIILNYEDMLNDLYIYMEANQELYGHYKERY